MQLGLAVVSFGALQWLMVWWPRTKPLSLTVFYLWVALVCAWMPRSNVWLMVAAAWLIDVLATRWSGLPWDRPEMLVHGVATLLAAGAGRWWLRGRLRQGFASMGPKGKRVPEAAMQANGLEGGAWHRTADDGRVVETARLGADAVEVRASQPFGQYRAMVRLVQSQLGLQSCAVYLHRPDRSREAAERGDDGELHLLPEASFSYADLHALLPPGQGILGAVIQGGHPLQHRVSASQSTAYYEQAQDIGQVIGVPISDGVRCCGVIYADRIAKEPFDEAAIKTLEHLASSAVAAIRDEDSLRRLRRSEERQGVLSSAAEQFAAALDEASVVSAVMEATRRIVEFDFAAVTRFDPVGQSHRVARAMGEGASRWEGVRFQHPNSLVSMSLARRCVLPLRGNFDAETQVLFDGQGNMPRMRHLWVFPLVSRDEALGNLVVARRTPWSAGQDARITLELLCNQAAIALSNADLVQRLESLATTDALTGCHNKRSFLLEFEAKLQAAERFGRPLSLLVSDLDHFKQVNDTHGHAVGDEVLKYFGSLLLQARRQTDVVARFGGEEFCVLCEETERDGAEQLAERIRAELAGTPVRTKAGDLQVTTSIGIACLSQENRTPSSLFESADKALYAAKLAGRNRVEVAGSGGRH